MDKAKFKKTTGIILNVLLYGFLLICVFAVIFTLLSGKSANGGATILGRQIRIVTTDSMAACDQTDVSEYKIGSFSSKSMIFIKTVPTDPDEAAAWYDALEIGDVLTFRYVYTSQVTITHRLVGKEANGKGGYILTLVGDNKSEGAELLTQVIDTSEKDSFNYVIGKVTGVSYILGILMSLIKEPIGIVLLVILPCFIIILLEVLRIYNVVNANKKKREQEEKAATENELAELRRKLAELKGEIDGNTTNTADTDKND